MTAMFDDTRPTTRPWVDGRPVLGIVAVPRRSRPRDASSRSFGRRAEETGRDRRLGGRNDIRGRGERVRTGGW